MGKQGYLEKFDFLPKIEERTKKQAQHTVDMWALFF